MVVTTSNGIEHKTGEWGEMWPMPACLAPMSAFDLDSYYRKWQDAGEDASAFPVDGDATARAEAKRCAAMLAVLMAGGTR